MGFFDFLKRGKVDRNDQQQPQQPQRPQQTPPPPPTGHPLSDPERFNAEILAAIPRYFSSPGMDAKFRAMGPNGDTPMTWSEAHPDIYGTWLSIQSLADRRGVIYGLLDEYLQERLLLWQYMERCNDDRYPQKALTLANQMKKAEDEQMPDFWNALARTNFILTNYAEAESNCRKAMALDNTNIRTKRVLADILHFTGGNEEAHKLYNEILEAKIPKDKPATIAIEHLIGFDGDILNSPIYAINWLKSDERITEETWEWATHEFFYSPHFRSQHAYWLIQNGERLKGLAKLASLADEMPWFKEALLNYVGIVDQTGLDALPPILERKKRYEQIIEDNNWTSEDMHQV